MAGPSGQNRCPPPANHLFYQLLLLLTAPPIHGNRPPPTSFVSISLLDSAQWALGAVGEAQQIHVLPRRRILILLLLKLRFDVSPIFSKTAAPLRRFGPTLLT